MDKLKISTAQFQNKSDDKAYNISVIEQLAQRAAEEGSNVIVLSLATHSQEIFQKNKCLTWQNLFLMEKAF